METLNELNDNGITTSTNKIMKFIIINERTTMIMKMKNEIMTGMSTHSIKTECYVK